MTTAPARLTRRTALAAIALAPGWLAAQSPAAPAEVLAELPGARMQGSGRLTFMMLAIYRARLWVGEGFDAAQCERTPLALELIYARTLHGKKIAQRSLDEMKRTGGFDEAQGARWLAAMTALFPDVNEGDRLVGVHRPGQSAAFFTNGKPAGEVRDAEFARRFFGIWLAPTSSQPKLRQQLLGAAQLE